MVFTLSRPIAILAIMGAVAAGSCGRRTGSDGRQGQVGWRPIVSLSGNGPSQSESFNIETGEWRIKWTARSRNSHYPEKLRVTVHSAISGRPLMVAIDHQGPGRDVTYINEDPRLYHLVIESSGVDWSLEIQEAVVGY